MVSPPPGIPTPPHHHRQHHQHHHTITTAHTNTPHCTIYTHRNQEHTRGTVTRRANCAGAMRATPGCARTDDVRACIGNTNVKDILLYRCRNLPQHATIPVDLWMCGPAVDVWKHRLHRWRSGGLEVWRSIAGIISISSHLFTSVLSFLRFYVSFVRVWCIHRCDVWACFIRCHPSRSSIAVIRIVRVGTLYTSGDFLLSSSFLFLTMSFQVRDCGVSRWCVRGLGASGCGRVVVSGGRSTARYVRFDDGRVV